MSAPLARDVVEAMSLKDVQTFYKDLTGPYKAFHHKAKKDKLIQQLEDGGYFGGGGVPAPAVPTPAAAEHGPAGQPGSGGNVSLLREQVQVLQRETSNSDLQARLTALFPKIATVERINMTKPGLATHVSRMNKVHDVNKGNMLTLKGSIDGTIQQVMANVMHGTVELDSKENAAVMNALATVQGTVNGECFLVKKGRSGEPAEVKTEVIAGLTKVTGLHIAMPFNGAKTERHRHINKVWAAELPLICQLFQQGCVFAYFSPRFVFHSTPFLTAFSIVVQPAAQLLLPGD